MGSQSGTRSLCQENFHLLVSVNTFRYFSVGGIGLEPTTSAMSTQCSNQLSYPPEGLPLYKGCEKLTIPCGIIPALWQDARHPKNFLWRNCAACWWKNDAARARTGSNIIDVPGVSFRWRR